MIDKIKQELENLGIYKRLLLKSKENILIAYLICMKYLCEIKEYNFEEVIQSEELYEITKDIKRIKTFYLKDKYPIHTILIKLKNINTKDLLLEFLNTFDKPIYLHTTNDKVAFINIESYPFSTYNTQGNITYISHSINPDILEFYKIFDKILNIKNEYISNTQIKDYDYVYLFEALKLRETTYKQLFNCIENNKNTILQTRYNNISNFREARFTIKNIKTIIIKDQYTTINFSNETQNQISIINYTDKIKDINKIINTNKKQKDTLVKITKQDIIDNNYRIGFNLYQLEKTSKIKDINKIVDQNTRYLQRLNTLNQQVETQINKLLNR